MFLEKVHFSRKNNGESLVEGFDYVSAVEGTDITAARSFWTSHLWIPLGVMAVILCGFELSEWDVVLQQYFYDASAHHWWFSSDAGWVETYLHDGAKRFTHLYADIFIFVFLGSYFYPRWKEYRRDCIFVVLAVLLATGLVSLLKHITDVHCPIQLSLFGGKYTYVHLFSQRIATEKAGVCWPSGHASAGFAFLSAYFVLHARRLQYAMTVLAAGILMGLFYGMVRVAQGQHFISHVLWSGILSWVVMVLLYRVVYQNHSEGEAIGRCQGSVAGV